MIIGLSALLHFSKIFIQELAFSIKSFLILIINAHFKYSFLLLQEAFPSATSLFAYIFINLSLYEKDRRFPGGLLASLRAGPHKDTKLALLRFFR